MNKQLPNCYAVFVRFRNFGFHTTVFRRKPSDFPWHWDYMTMAGVPPVAGFSCAECVSSDMMWITLRLITVSFTGGICYSVALNIDPYKRKTAYSMCTHLCVFNCRDFLHLVQKAKLSANVLSPYKSFSLIQTETPSFYSKHTDWTLVQISVGVVSPRTMAPTSGQSVIWQDKIYRLHPLQCLMALD